MAVVSLILSKFQNIFAIFVGSDISILHKKGGQSCRSELETLTPGITPRVGVSYSGFNSHERKRVHRMAIILAITNSKGGVGKTTTCANLGAALSAAGKAVLLVDNDPQGDLTKVMRSDPKSLKYTLANLMNAVLDDTEPELFVNRAVIEGAGIHYIPANSKLAGVSSRLVALQMSSRYRGGETGGTPCELVMARVLELFQSQYDYILIDCGHSMDLLTINALAAAHQAIVPVQAHYLAMEDMADTLEVIQTIRQGINPKLAVGGILLTMYQGRTNLCRGIQDEIQADYGNAFTVFSSPIDFSIRVAEHWSGQYLCIRAEQPRCKGLLRRRTRGAILWPEIKCRTHSGNGNEVKRRRRWQMARRRREPTNAFSIAMISPLLWRVERFVIFRWPS